MAVRYLLDTNTCSYIIKGIPLRVRERLLQVPMGEVGISAVTEAELRFGLARLRQSGGLAFAVEEFLLRLEILPWNSDSAKEYAGIRATLEERGEPMGNFDMMNAAQALAAEAVLVTSDREFHRLKRLSIEDWAKPV